MSSWTVEECVELLKVLLPRLNGLLVRRVITDESGAVHIEARTPAGDIPCPDCEVTSHREPRQSTPAWSHRSRSRERGGHTPSAPALTPASPSRSATPWTT